MKQNMQNQTISELYTDDKISKYSSKNVYENIDEIFSNISNRKKISNKQIHHWEANNFLEKFTKSVNTQTNINSPGNDSLTAKLYKHLSNELYPIL